MGEVSQSRLALLASLILCSSSAGHSTKNVVVVMQSGRDNGDWRAREKGYQMIRTAVDTWLSNHTKKVLVTDPRTAKRHTPGYHCTA